MVWLFAVLGSGQSEASRKRAIVAGSPRLCEPRTRPEVQGTGILSSKLDLWDSTIGIETDGSAEPFIEFSSDD